MAALKSRDWVPSDCERHVQTIAEKTSCADTASLIARLESLADQNRVIHETECFNLNPATNVMSPRAEKFLASGLSSRPSLGYPGDKYEMGLEAIEEIEIVAAELCAEIFDASFAEIRVASGAMANFYAFMATCRPGDAIIVPPAEIGGHVTHHPTGCAGLYDLEIHYAPIDDQSYSYDLSALLRLSEKVQPKLITVGGSLNLYQHPVQDVSDIARRTGARVLFDAAHVCGMIAGQQWPNPLSHGADIMTMSTYKSLAGPAGGLILTNDEQLAERIEAIAFPGMTANFDVSKSAAIALTMLDWKVFGRDYARQMVKVAQALASELEDARIPVFRTKHGPTLCHQFAIEAGIFGGGQAAAKKLRKAGFLTCGIGLPAEPVENDMNGLRIGTPEIVRWGVTETHAPVLARLIVSGLTAEESGTMAAETAQFRREFDTIHYVH